MGPSANWRTKNGRAGREAIAVDLLVGFRSEHVFPELIRIGSIEFPLADLDGGNTGMAIREAQTVPEGILGLANHSSANDVVERLDAR